MTHLAKAILQEQGYDVKLLNADLAPIFTSLARKKADVFMDVWLPVTMSDYIEQYGDKLEIIGDIYDEARIGPVSYTHLIFVCVILLQETDISIVWVSISRLVSYICSCILIEFIILYLVAGIRFINL